MGDDSTTGEYSPTVPWISAEELADWNNKFYFTRSASVLPYCAQEAIFKTRRHARNTLLVASNPALLNQREIATIQLSSKRLNREDAMRVAKYLAEEAPIVVHFKPEDILAKLLKDGVYRNLFETGTSNGNSDKAARDVWEMETFQGAYNNADPKDRPKYGVLNIMNDPRGAFSCVHTYGRAYLVLKNTPEVRSRVTFSDCDTSSKGSVCVDCDWKHMMLLMLNMDTIDLNEVLEVASGRNKCGSSYYNYCRKTILPEPYTRYNEVQIHGPLRLAFDVEKIVLDKSYKEEMSPFLEEIKATYGVPYEWQSFELTKEEAIYQAITECHVLKAELFTTHTVFYAKMWIDAYVFWCHLQQ
jgi:hypothetical protein